MSYKPCLLIPIYNHKDSIGHTVGRLVEHQLPIFIVDDGSDDATQAVLQRLAAESALVQVFRLAENQGKGAAVLRGMREARNSGYTHALQIDADGQHDTSDVPRFVEAGRENPADVICGAPIYDASAPKSRQYGRYITHFWVWIETLSLSIKDSMCGFRLYPLAAACALDDEVRLPTRMDFDTAIAVRLAWRNVRFQNIPTAVTYPRNGLSHFDMWRDNWRISRLHTSLVCGMLMRLPVLLWRKFRRDEGQQAHWSRLAERGSGIGLKALVLCHRHLGAVPARFLLYPIVAYFLITGSEARTASLDYLRRLHAFRAAKGPVAEPVPGWRDCFRHMFAFAQSGLDKLAAWTGAIDNGDVDFPNRSEFESLLASGRGAVLIGSHLGSLDMTRALATDQQRAVVNAVVFTEHARKFNSVMAQVNPGFAVNLIEVSHLGPDTAIMLKERIDRGEFVVIVGDRTPPSRNGRLERLIALEFLGRDAPFAQGPFILASVLDCPVYLFFCLRENRRHRIYFEHFSERVALPRSNRADHLRAYMRRYVSRLEALCLQAPFQWFNFYDFWKQGSADGHDRPGTEEGRVSN